MSVQIVRCGAELPDAFERLRVSAQTEGYAFLDRLQANWTDGHYEDDPHASVFAGVVGGELQAIGAQTHDSHEIDPARRRMRHFYVHPDARRAGVGRALAGALIQEGFQFAPQLTLRATHALSTAFWDAMGFARVDHPSRTHLLRRDV